MKYFLRFILLVLILLASCNNNPSLQTASTSTSYPTPSLTFPPSLTVTPSAITATPLPTSTSTLVSTATPVAFSSDTDKRLLAFRASLESKGDGIYIMHLDGSGLTNLTNELGGYGPFWDPFWAPDGMHIAFAGNGVGSLSPQIYLMDANGSNVVQLTDSDTYHQFEYSNPWSPDEKKLLFTEMAFDPGPEGVNTRYWKLYSIDVDGQNKTLLADDLPDTGNIHPSWSPDGKHVAFISPIEQSSGSYVNRIYVVNTKGGKPTNVTKLLPAYAELASLNYTWSPDGQSIVFIAAQQRSSVFIDGHMEDVYAEYAVYEASLDGKTLTKKATFSTPIDSWWNGIAFVADQDTSTLTWLRSDGTSNTFQPLVNCQPASDSSAISRTDRSASGNLIVSVRCPNDDLWFYWADADGKTVKQLFKFPILAKHEQGFELNWSPDDKYAAISLFSSSSTADIYVINVDESLKDPTLQPFHRVLPHGYGGISWQPVPSIFDSRSE